MAQLPVARMKRVLTVPALVFFGLAYMVPLGIFTTYGEVSVLSQGHLILAYIITLTAMIFTAHSYCKMTSQLPLAGSAYSYVQKTFGGNVGFMVGWTQLLDYLFLPIINYLVIGIYLNNAFPAIPAAVFVLISIIAVTLLNILGIKLINSMNTLIVMSQFIFIIVFLLLCFYSQTAWDYSTLMRPLQVASHQIPGIFNGAAILCLAFLGFDAIATLAEETKNPKQTLPRAIMWTVLIAGILFIVISYFAHLAYPEWENFLADPDTAGLLVFKHVGGSILVAAFIAIYVTGVFASAMTSHASIVRIFYAMGREGVLPKKIFSYLHPDYRTPTLSIVFVSITSLLALVLDLSIIVSMISFGALIAFMFVNMAVIKHFIFNRSGIQQRRTKKLLFSCGLLPAVGFCLIIWLWFSLSKTALSIGLVWSVAGFVYLLVLTKGFTKKPPAISDEETQTIID